MAPPFSALLAALALVVLAVAVFCFVAADGPTLDRLRRRAAWGRLPPVARQHWATLGGAEQEAWKLHAAKLPLGAGDHFEALAAALAFQAWLDGTAGLAEAALAPVLAFWGAARPAPPAPAAPAPFRPTAEGLEARVVHTSDPQNVHDSLVLQNLREVARRLRADEGAAPLPSLGEIVAGLEAFGAAAGGEAWGRAAAAAASLDFAPLASLGGASPRECLQRVWLRADDPRNAANRENIRRAVFDALAACWEAGEGGAPELVCETGRAANVLASLATLDFDPENSAGARLEEVRNEAFRAAAGAVRRAAAEAAAAAGDEGRRLAARAHLAASAAELAALPAAPPAAAEAFAAELRRAAVGAAEACCAAAGLPAGAPLAARLRAEVAAAV